MGESNRAINKSTSDYPSALTAQKLKKYWASENVKHIKFWTISCGTGFAKMIRISKELFLLEG
ncbi:hypothetical protein [Paenibacillus pedocola]|uniref:hypothetical protein n=1 Tax=Paenibacillus pedocola TaxID=3242193 RepID=UPI002877AFB3|nr:hypothetical protein [Paenibacillus typhae]